MYRTRCVFPSDILPLTTVSMTRTGPRNKNNRSRKKQDNENNKDTVEMPAVAAQSPANSKSPRLSQHQSRVRKERAPVSCEREHRHVLDTVKHVLQQLRTFREKFSLDAIDYNAAKSCATDLMLEWGVHPTSSEENYGGKNHVSDDVDSGKGDEEEFSRPGTRSSVRSYNKSVDEGRVRTWEEFKKLLDKNEVSKQLKKTNDFKHLTKFIGAVEKFEKMSPNIHNRLVNAFRGHLYKYCISLAQEPNAFEVKTIREYDERICDYEKEIDGKMNKNKELYDEYIDMKKPFIRFLDTGADVSEIIARMAQNTKQICAEMRKWVDDDRSYPDRLYDEITFSHLVRDNIISDIKKYKEKCDDFKLSRHKREIKRMSVIQRLEEARHARKKIRTSLETVEQKIERNMADVDKKLRQLEDLENQMSKSKRKNNPLGSINQLTARSEQLKQDIERLEQSNNSHIKQKERLVRNRNAVNDDVSTLEKDLEMHNLAQEELKQSLDADEANLDKHVERLRKHDAHVIALKRTREKKLSSDVLKKIFHQKLTENNRDDLGEACKVVAKLIGKNWISLYEELPFSPMRDSSRRMRDVEMIDRIGARNDGTYNDLAMSSLRKWRMFHRKGTVNELVYSLKRIEQRQLAQKIHREFMQQESS